MWDFWLLLFFGGFVFEVFFKYEKMIKTQAVAQSILTLIHTFKTGLISLSPNFWKYLNQRTTYRNLFILIAYLHAGNSNSSWIFY